MEIELLVSEAGTMSFARRVSSEADFDFLRFYVDSIELGAWSGTLPWGEVSYPVSAGSHKLTWSYEKDDIASARFQPRLGRRSILPPHRYLVPVQTPDDAGWAMTVAPNPSTGATTLLLDLPEEQALGIRVFDYLGRQVLRVLPPERMPAGGQRSPSI